MVDVNALIPIGANMDGFVDWTRSLPYVNLVRQSRTWGSPGAPWDGNATLDLTTGWPTSDFGMVIATDNLDLGGEYLFSAKGNAEISFEGGCSGYVTNKTYDSTRNTVTAILNVPEGEQQLFFGFRNTTGPGLQDIALLQPSYGIESKSNITKVMLAHLSRFSIIRFMDWTETNGNFEHNWNDTTPPNWPNYRTPHRNPWQTIPYLANQIGKPIDIWINIPHNATDDYILNVARIIYNDLNPTNNIYVEYSNEVWNWGFPQSVANLHAANESVVKDGDPYHFNYDNCSNGAFWAWRRTAYQIKHISDLFKTVFGNDSVGQWKRVRPILAGQVAYPLVIRTGLQYLDTVFGPPSNYLHGMAGAPYFNLGEYSTWTNLTTDQVLQAFQENIQDMSPEQGWGAKHALGAHAVYAAWYSLAFHGYEGGPDGVLEFRQSCVSPIGETTIGESPQFRQLAKGKIGDVTVGRPDTGGSCGDCSLQAKINATRDPRMTDVCVTYLNAWYRFGFEELNWFGAGANAIGKYGSWGLLEDMRQEILIDTTMLFNTTSPVAQLPRPSPKLKAVDQVRQSSAEFNFGIPIPASNINATNFVEHQEPYPYPYVNVAPENSTFLYPLKITQSPIRINVTVYAGGLGGILEGGLNNEQFVQIETPNTVSWSTFAASPVMQFNLSQTKVPSIVALRFKNIRSPYRYTIRSFDVVLA